MKKLFFLLLLCSPIANAQVTALTCSAADANAAFSAATAGQTVTLPAGSCTWVGANAVVLAKSITMKGSGPVSAPTTVITIDGSVSSVFHVTKQTTGVIRIQNIKFIISNGGVKATPHAVVFDGPWPNGQPIVFTNNTIQLSGTDFATIATPGGVIMSGNTIHGTIVGDTLVALKLPSDNTSWTTPDSLGTRDTTGWMNTYIETNFFDGGSNATDCDDECRIVFRFNTGQTGGTFNSHGADSSPYGMRQFEIYNNIQTLPDKSCPGGNPNSPSNINQWDWIRGGSGVIYNNQQEPLVTACWGTKSNFKLANRGAEDDRWLPTGPPTRATCAQVTYPAYHQIGQNFSTVQFTDPIWFWGNTTTDPTRKPNGLFIDISNGWEFGNPCGFNWNTFWQWGRDGQNTSLTLPIVNPAAGGNQEGQGGTPKPGYTAYPYPHPLVGGSAPSLSASPSPASWGSVALGNNLNLSITITNSGSASQINATPYAVLTGDYSNTNTGTCGDGSTIVPAGSCTVIVKFTPTVVGTRTGTLTINGTATVTDNLTGVGTAPAVTLNPTSIAFGSQTQGTPSVNHPVTLTNSGTAPLLITSISASASYFLNSNTCGANLAPSASCGFNVVFTPGSVGSIPGTVTVVTNASTSPDTVTLSGTGTALPTTVITILPNPLAFGGQVQSTPSAAKTVTLSSVGTANEVLNTPYFTITGPNAADFAVSGASCTNGGTVAPSTNCTVPIVFTPSTTSAETAVLNISGTVSGSISLSGTGVAPSVTPAPAPVLFVSAPLPTQPIVSNVVQASPCAMNNKCNYTMTCAPCSASTQLYLDGVLTAQTYANGTIAFTAKLSAGVHNYLAVNIQ